MNDHKEIEVFYFSPENFKGEIFNNLKRSESKNMKLICSIWINTVMANVSFSTCSLNSADVYDDYVVDGDDDVGDTDGDE